MYVTYRKYSNNGRLKVPYLKTVVDLATLAEDR